VDEKQEEAQERELWQAEGKAPVKEKEEAEDTSESLERCSLLCPVDW
jgi:hypothetical protein